ncbi:hypothetical protein L1987_15190 [Smallanthus sonchifolius]|uniref:Uncharacterized protein n=1 Tax=Smallanthus sonchifolius TaxID=185202 RepID=A0ACB9J5E1_9ASTR|nr:hypothetical protein L1987_15190 [Smallanthus sonchifolius]
MTSNQVTANTQKLLDELIRTPPVDSSSSTINLLGNILKMNDAQHTLIETQRSQLFIQQLQIESLSASLEKVLKHLAAHGESSWRNYDHS